jgi:pimeloyl-ACP methyl ester carboxylesterase
MGSSKIRHFCDFSRDVTTPEFAHRSAERTMQSRLLVSNSRETYIPTARPTIIFVHSGFSDGLSWRPVCSLLRDDGYSVRIVQKPTTSLADDVAATRRAIDAEDGPVVLVGCSYGGAVITEAGDHPRVSALLFVAAFVPDKGESVSWLINDPTPNAPLPLPIPRAALSGSIADPAWRSKPSWYLVVADDRMIPRRAQSAMAKRARSMITETAGGHDVYASRPAAVAAFIANATSHTVARAKCA